MNQVMAIAKKEWRAAFLSPVALIFLGIFLAASLFVLFFLEGFFARNIADARPFFNAMPILLVFLTSAFTMRLWSEEARSGTLEVLMTLPMRIREIILGKFIAGLGLVAVALLITLPVPLTISILGDLDWGPVIGGYLGLLLLASAYLAIGMFMSSLTDNQLVALMMSLVVCGLFVLLGYLPQVVQMGLVTDEFLRALGTGSRFESMLRGVLDLRDLVYYASLAGLFLVFNGLVLEVRRWGSSEKGVQRKNKAVTTVVLLVANLFVLNLGLSQTMSLRADLTEWGEYSISPVTRDMLAGATEPLLIRGYFSENTHPLLDPLMPRIRDFLKELRAAGGDNVTVEFVDPTQDESAEIEAMSKYGIRSVPFMFSDRHKDSVVNAYFHIVVRYGDGHEVLDFKDLIDVDVHGTDIKVRLRNLEYDLARTVQKVVYGFKSIESICNRLPDKAKLKLFATTGNLPDDIKEVPDRIEKVAKEFSSRCGERFSFERVDPTDKGAGLSPQDIYNQYGIKPMALSLFGRDYFYMHMIMQVGKNKPEVLNAAAALTEADVRKELEASLGRHAPGLLKTVGLVISDPKPQRPAYPGMPQPPPQGLKYERMRQLLTGTYEVTKLDLKSGRVPGHIDVLALLNPQDLDEKARYAIDQFLMRGGSVLVVAGKHVFHAGMGGELNLRKVTTGLEDLLAHYGVKVADSIVLDENNADFPVPEIRQIPGLGRVRQIKMIPYPPFVLVQGDGLNSANPAVSTLPAVVLHWASPVTCVASVNEENEKDSDKKDKKEKEQKTVCEALLHSSADAWTVSQLNPSSTSFAPPSKREKLPLAVSVVGNFESYYKDREPPVLDEGDKGEEADKKSGRKRLVIERSERVARLVVLGSANFISDTMLGLGRQQVSGNLQLINNLTDWAVEDAELLSIRSKEQYARTLKQLKDPERRAWEAGNFGLAAIIVILIGVLTLGRRKRATPMFDYSSDKDKR